MPNLSPSTGYGWVVYDLKDIARDLQRQRDSTESITEVDSALAHFYLKKVLEDLILATRVSREWPSLSQQMQSLTNCRSPTETSIDSQLHPTSVAS